MQNTREISFNILKEVKPVDSGVFCNSELLYLSVSSPALVSLHRTWKKLNKGETLGKGWRRRRWRWRPGVGAGGGATGGSTQDRWWRLCTKPLGPSHHHWRQFHFPRPFLPCLLASTTASPAPSWEAMISGLESSSLFYLQDILLKVS